MGYFNELNQWISYAEMSILFRIESAAMTHTTRSEISIVSRKARIKIIVMSVSTARKKRRAGKELRGWRQEEVHVDIYTHVR